MEFPVLENKLCNQFAHLNGSVKDHEICVGYIDGAIDNCMGDSGGPFVCYSNNTFVIQGVISWRGCNNAMKPVVYPRVSKFVDWINSEIKKYS